MMDSKQKKGTAELILDGLDNSDITVNLPEEDHFSKQNMAGAIEFLSKYLTPIPSDSDKKSFDYTKFSVVTPKAEMQKFIEEHVVNGTVLSTETMLLVIECITRSNDSVKKAMCRLDEMKKSSGIQFVFQKWLSYAIQIMEKKRKLSGNSFRNNLFRTEEMIAISAMELICAFTSNVIKKEKQLNVLKTKFGVDWEHIVGRTTEFAKSYNIIELLNSCKKASTYLENVRSGTPMPYKARSLPNIPDYEDDSEIMVVGVIQTNDATSVAGVGGKNINASPHSSNEIIKTKIQGKTREGLNKNHLIGANRTGSVSNASFQSPRTAARQETSTRIGSSSVGDGGHSGSRNRALGSARSSVPSGGERGQNGSRNEAVGSSHSSGPSAGDWGLKGSRNRAVGGTHSSEKRTGPGWRPLEESRGGWHRYKRTNPSDGDRSKYSQSKNEIRESERKDTALPKTDNRKPHISSMNYGDLMANRVDLNSSDKDGVDGLAGLPGYSNWKKPSYDSESVVSKDQSRNSTGTSSKSSHTLNQVDLNDSSSRGVDGLADLPGYSSWRSGGKNSTFQPDKSSQDSLRKGSYDRKRTDRSSDFQRQDNYKRQRVADDPSSSGRADRWGSQPSGSSAGRGRGKDRTLPAWMSKQQDSITQIGTKTNEVNDIAEKALDAMIPTNVAGPDSRGRGRGRTLPAWMTSQNSGNTDSVPNRPAGSGKTSSNDTNRSQSFNEPRISSNPRTNNNATASDSSTRFSGDTSMGRGRGRDRTKPAWMTKDNASISTAPRVASSTQNHQNNLNTSNLNPSDLDSRGRGRGRTLPAWMTKNNSSGVVTNVDKLDDRNENRNSDVSSRYRGSSNTHSSRSSARTLQGTGRGRGRESTLPAWMTQK